VIGVKVDKLNGLKLIFREEVAVTGALYPTTPWSMFQ
jgi:hypothetical protein